MQDVSANQEAIRKIAEADDPVMAFREIIESEGGYWCDQSAKGAPHLFEVHLFGIASVGAGAHDAVQQWLNKAHSMEETNHVA